MLVYFEHYYFEKIYKGVATLPLKRTVKDAIELLRNSDLGQMVRYAASI